MAAAWRHDLRRPWRAALEKRTAIAIAQTHSSSLLTVTLGIYCRPPLCAGDNSTISFFNKTRCRSDKQTAPVGKEKRRQATFFTSLTHTDPRFLLCRFHNKRRLAFRGAHLAGNAESRWNLVSRHGRAHLVDTAACAAQRFLLFSCFASFFHDKDEPLDGLTLFLRIAGTSTSCRVRYVEKRDTERYGSHQ